TGGTADRNRSHWSTSKTPSYTKSVSWQHHPILQLQPDREQFIPVMEDYWKTYPPVYLYYPKNAGRTKRVKALIDFLIMHAADDAEKVGSSR
ncbi:hypothetical protein ACVQH3_16035, partial [Klebsiella pneumoniae]